MITNVNINLDGFVMNLSNGETYSCNFAFRSRSRSHGYMTNDDPRILIGKYIRGLSVGSETLAKFGEIHNKKSLTLSLSDQPYEFISQRPMPSCDSAIKAELMGFGTSKNPHSSRSEAVQMGIQKAKLRHYNIVNLRPQSKPSGILEFWSFHIGNIHDGNGHNSYKFVFGDLNLHTLEGEI